MVFHSRIPGGPVDTFTNKLLLFFGCGWGGEVLPLGVPQEHHGAAVPLLSDKLDEAEIRELSRCDPSQEEDGGTKIQRKLLRCHKPVRR